MTKKINYVYTYCKTNEYGYDRHHICIREANKSPYDFPKDIKNIGYELLEFTAQSGGTSTTARPYGLHVKLHVENYRLDASVKLLNKIKNKYKGSFTFIGLIKFFRENNIPRIFYDRNNTECWIPQRFKNSAHLYKQAHDKQLNLSRY